VSDGRRSFWSSIPGLITGVAGLLTGVVGLITLLVQQGIVGNSSSDKPASGVTTTVAAGGAGATPATATGSIVVDPKAVRFTLADPAPKQVTVKNASTVAITIPTPVASGKDGAQFAVDPGDCTKSLRPNLSCTMTVTFKASAALTTYTAKLEIVPSGNVLPQEVALSASTL